MLTASPDLKTLYDVAEWAIRLGALAVVPLRRSPAAARGWLLLIFFLPIVGLLLFLTIGSPKFPQWRKERFARLRPYLARVDHDLGACSPDLGERAPMAAAASRLGMSSASMVSARTLKGSTGPT